MKGSPPLLNQLDLVVRDMDATLRFYRLLGLEIPESAVWRTASGAHHTDVTLPNGFHLHFDSIALTKSYDSGWREMPASGTRDVIGFSMPSREEVDERFAELVAAGYAGAQPPYDAFWGARYAIVEDPDGIAVGLMSPISAKHRAPPPEV